MSDTKDARSPDAPPSDDRRRAVLALALLVPVPSLAVIAAMFMDLGATGQVVWGASKLIQIAFPVVWWIWILKQKPSFSPLGRRSPSQGDASDLDHPVSSTKTALAVGIGVGLFIAGLIIGGYLLLGPRLITEEVAAGFRAQAAENGLDQRTKFFLFVIGISCFNALMEEYLWRWFVHTRCEKIAGSARLAIPLGAALFTLHHVIALGAQFDFVLTVLTSLGVFIGGVVWSMMYTRYRSIWPSYLSHCLVNLGMFVPAYWMLFPK